MGMRRTRVGGNETRRPLIPAVTGIVPVLSFVLFLLALSPGPATAQYFGRNKVQYDDFHFRVLETKHFRIQFYRRESPRAVRDAGRMAERWYERLARTFQHAFREKKPIILYADEPDFQQTNAVSGFVSQATGGVTEGMKDRVILPFAESYGETNHVLGHELVHAFQYDIAQSREGGGRTGFQQLPLWAVEGLAEYLSLGRHSPLTAMWMRDAVLRNDFPTIKELSEGTKYFPYRFGQALWAYIGGRWGDDMVGTFYRRAARQGLAAASRTVLHLPLDSLSAQWRRDTRAYYAGLMQGRHDPDEVGSRIEPRSDSQHGRIYVSPEVSPDGSKVVYLSRRNLFTMDLYVADARTGTVEGKLASASSNPHLDQLAYINTSGAWSPDGKRFAFVSYANGNNEIDVADVAERSIVHRYQLRKVGAVYSMDWSPDGRTIAFSGASGGITDLYTLDLEDGSVRQLTHDRWTQLYPAYSPDGSTLAFSTDEGGTSDMAHLQFGPLGLAFMNLKTGAVTLRRPFPGAEHIDPRWSPDGSSLYFISDRDGFSDVYRLSLSDGTVWRLTRVATGVSGVTELSPALTVARKGGQVLFTVFRHRGYQIRRLSSQQTHGRSVARGARVADAAGVLPPGKPHPPAWVGEYLADATTGLPDSTSFHVHGYDSDLALDYIAEPTAGVAVDRFGTSLGGSVAAYFSDMLGNHQLGIGLEANGQVKDIGGQAVYSDLTHRWNWSLAAARFPYRTGGAYRGTATVNGRTVPTVDILVNRTVLNEATAGVRYPFSTTRRFEANAGFSHIGFSRERFRTYYDSLGIPVGQDRQTLAAPAGLNLYHASVALVEDRSFMGFTSPVRGTRARLQVETNVGDLTYTNVLADFRRYFFVSPVTFAFRAFHYGRYGKDANSPRLSPLFLGFESFVRGYSPNSFTAGECTRVPGNPTACPEFDRLLGSRIAVGNVEIRVPLNGTERFGLFHWGVLPVELALFADGGVAWSAGQPPDLAFREHSTRRIPVFSAGVTARWNILGRLVVETFYAYPFQRPGKGWTFGFRIAPGW